MGEAFTSPPESRMRYTTSTFLPSSFNVYQMPPSVQT